MLYPTELRAPAVGIAAAARPEQRRRRRWRALTGALLLVAGSTAAGGAADVVRVSPVPVVRLDDGRAVVLAGVVVPPGSAGAAEALAVWFGDGAVEPGELPGGKDRHGRVRAAPARAGATAQAALVAAGLALADPEGLAEPGLARALLAAEAEARRRRRGLWAASRAQAPQAAAADEVAAEPARFALVDGTIVRVGRTHQFWYANFGHDLRRDFTFRVPVAAEGGLAAGGLDLRALAGRRVRVRGWLFEDNGPMIEITTPLALETLE